MKDDRGFPAKFYATNKNAFFVMKSANYCHRIDFEKAYIFMNLFDNFGTYHED